MPRRLLLALGGNAFLPQKGTGTIQEQRAITMASMSPLARMLAPQDHVVITHGNGPVVGNILLRNQAAADRIPPMPLDICDADSQGGIGYMIVQCLGNALAEAGVKRPVTALVTRVRVDPNDPAFLHPQKPIGPFYTEEEAKRFAREQGWSVTEDSGRGWRRVVPSPAPKEILELRGIQDLIQAGHVVVAAGGGGVPVTLDATGQEHGVEAVIDKDRASAFLASALGFETFVIVTGVSHVAIGFGKPEQKNLDRITVSDARRYMSAGEFGEGSMKPKIESALAFLEQGGRDVLITSPEDLGPALAGQSGTRVIPG
ncbi:MAG TPA: carbamate kinase [Dongiaceae bacterium]|jgi:carbamate kinase|nr:carbamate kinase [Dongiaceae bacterium]